VLAVAVLSRRLPGMPVRGLLGHGLRLLLAVAPAGAAAYGITMAFRLWSSAKLVQLLALAVAGVVAIVIFLVLARLLRISEVSQLLAFVRRRRRPAPAPLDDEASIQTVIRPLREFYGESGTPEPRIDSDGTQPPIDATVRQPKIDPTRSYAAERPL